MCLICDHLKDKKMSAKEASRGLIELRTFNRIDTEHYQEALEMLKEAQKIEDDKKTINGLRK